MALSTDVMGFDAHFRENSQACNGDTGLGTATDTTKLPQPSALDLHQFKTKVCFLRLH
ncbi:MAG: hypothetical protein JO141_26040 [Bradyrhizobium sp.]|nr:hypothetical protein [Bradyrhizobium sp.]